MRWKLIFGLIFLLVSVGFIFALSEGGSISEATINVFEIRYETFDGDTTEFSDYNEEELSNLSGIILEKTLYGKVEFGENLDIMSMDGGDMIVDFDADLNISDNLINVDEYNLPGINKSAVLYIYGLDFVEPLIYHNGVECTTCTLLDYSAGILRFSTTEFEGAYYVMEGGEYCGDGICNNGEDCNNCPGDCGECEGGGDEGGDTGDIGGGGGGDIPPVDDITGDIIPGEFDFYLDPTTFSVEMGKGTYYRKVITVTNNGTKDLPISVYVEDLGDFIFPEVRFFMLAPGESRDVRLDIYVSNQRFADVYVGKIRFQTSLVTRYTKAILNVKERDALFDIRTEVLKKYVNPGSRVRANISLINMGDLRNFDVELEYKIIDFDKNVYTLKKEDFAISRTYRDTFYLDVPKDIPIGDYLFYSKVTYPPSNVSASSYDTFVVEKISYLSWILLIIIILLIMYFVYRWYKSKRYEIYEKFREDLLKKREERKLSGMTSKVKKKQKIKEVPELP
jgi:hypothetical protein